MAHLVQAVPLCELRLRPPSVSKPCRLADPADAQAGVRAKGYAFANRYSAALIDVLAVDGRVSVDGCISIFPSDPIMPPMSLLFASISLLISLR